MVSEFCKAFGTDVNTNNKLYIYGPYSQQVADSLQDGVQDEIFIEANGSIGKGQKYTEYIDSLPETEILKDRQEEMVAAVLGGAVLFPPNSWKYSQRYYSQPRQKTRFCEQ